MDAQTVDRTAARVADAEDTVRRDRDAGPAQVALSNVFDQLAMLEDVVGALVPELDKILNPHDGAEDGGDADCAPAPATSELTADLNRLGGRLEATRRTLQSVRRRIEL